MLASEHLLEVSWRGSQGLTECRLYKRVFLCEGIGNALTAGRLSWKDLEKEGRKRQKENEDSDVTVILRQHIQTYKSFNKHHNMVNTDLPLAPGTVSVNVCH